MDLNFATGLHNLVNAVLFLLVQIPDMTYLRCLRYCGEGQLKCAPDLEPFFAFLVAGLTSLGTLVDNWLDVIYVVPRHWWCRGSWGGPRPRATR